MPESRYNRRPVEEGPIEDQRGRVQPQALDFEESVIGAMLSEREAYFMVRDIVKADSFYDPRHKVIFEAVEHLVGENTPIDIRSVATYLFSIGRLDDAGGVYNLNRLAGEMVTAAHIEYHAQIVAEKYLARQLISYANDIHEKSYDSTIDVSELMKDAEGGLFLISQANMQKDYKHVNPILDEAYEMLKKAAANTGGLSGVSSGFDKLDEMTQGWQKSDLIIVAGRPGMGKTAFVLSMAKNIAIDNSVPTAVFSLEMSGIQLGNRLLSNVCGLESSKLKIGNLDPEEWSQLDEGLKLMRGKPLYLDDTPSLSILEFRTKARRLVREENVQIIIIDYLQLMTTGNSGKSNRQEDVSTISRSLKGLAKELNVPIIALSQVSRNLETRAGNDAKTPQLSDLRESGAIEQDADMVCFIHRPEYFKIFKDKDGNDTRGKAQVIIAKHRNGPIGDVYLDFTGKFARFSNPGQYSDAPQSSGRGQRIVESGLNKYMMTAEDDIDAGVGPMDVPPVPSDDIVVPF